MMKKHVKVITGSVVAAALLLSTPLFADEATKNRLDKLESVVQQLVEQNQKLMEENSALKESVGKLQLEEMQDELGDLGERMDEVETFAFSDKLKFQLGFQTRVDNYSKEYADGSKITDNNIWTNRLRLEMFSDIYENLKFNGRLSMYKYWADSDENSLSSRDAREGRSPGSSALYVERAYVDWTLLDGDVPLILTLGRQPGGDGPSHQFKDNTVRKSTYSALAFDGAVDGAVVTANLQKVTELDNAAIRLVYGKGFQAHDNLSYSNTANYTGVDINTSSNNTLEDTIFSGFFIDGAIPGVSNTLVQIGYVQGKDFVFNDLSNANNPSSNENIGDMSVYGIMAEATNLLDSGLDIFAHYGVSEAKSNGNYITYSGANLGMMATDSDGDGVLDDTDTQKGDAIWAGMRYTLPFNEDMKIGYEFNRGSKNWFPFTYGSNDLTNKLAARGVAHEVYYIHDINRYANVRLGGTMIDYEYTGSGDYRGAPSKIADLPAAQQSSYVDKLTNYYLLFNLLF